MQALNVGGTLTDTFTATTIDGTAQLVTITINGTNDVAVITGPVAAAVIEAGGVANGTSGTPTATGDLNSTDVDNPNDTWTAVGSPTASANGYGSYTLTAAGVWIYTLNNSNAAVQALNVGDTLTDSFTVTTIGGAAQLVTVTINGANDAAVITGATTGDVIEAGGVGFRHSGHPGRDRQSGHHRSGQPAGRLDRGRHAHTRRQWLRHLHADSGRRLDLHAGQQQPRRAGARHRRHADRYIHRHHGRRHRPAGHHHHPWHRRRRGDQRRYNRDGARSRRCRQRNAGHAHRHRGS